MMKFWKVSLPLLLSLTLTYPQITQSTPLPTFLSPEIQHHHTRDNSLGTATVTNACTFPVYLWSVGDTSSPAYTLAPGGGTYTEEYQQRSNGGFSLKASLDDTLDNCISQLEYTVVPDGLYEGVFWDLSHVNGDPFEAWGEKVVPVFTGDSVNLSTCEAVTCVEGEEDCMEAYNEAEDHWATHECGLQTNLVWTFCSGT